MSPPLRAQLVIVASCLLLAAPAAAQQPDAASQQGAAGTPPPPKVVRVKPPPPPPRPPKAAAKPPPRLKRGRAVAVDIPPGTPMASSPTFARLDDGSTRIWVEVSSKVDVTENKAEGRLVYRLHGAAAPVGTSLLPLVTDYFATPVERAHVVQQGPDVDVVIELRRPTEATHRVLETPRGVVLQVDFPRVAGDDGPSAPAERPRARRGTDTTTIHDTPHDDDD